MSKQSNIAKQYLSWGLSVIPTRENKRPALTGWTDLQKTPLSIEEVDQLYNREKIRPEIENAEGEKVGIKVFDTPKGIAIITGEVSGNLEVIDVDSKYDLTGTLWEELRDSIPTDLYSRLVVAQTVSGGYHIYYRAPEVAGNSKLANRPATPEEMKEGDKVKALLETRGEGGYVIAPPTKGYQYLQGSPENIPTLTETERDRLLRIAKSFNELEEEEVTPEPTRSTDYPGLSPFEDYNDRGEVVDLLEKHGWTIVNNTKDRVHLLRPGQTDSKTSGNFHKGLRVLKVFSSSTEFNPDKGYSASQVFSLLECNGDHKLAYRELLRLGYGDPPPGSNQIKTSKITVTGVNSVNKETSVISNPGDSLTVEHLQDYKEVTITAPEGSTEEVLQAIDILEGTGKRVYIKEPGAEEVRGYQYKLQQILTTYGQKQERSGGLTDRDIDRLLEEVVETASRLSPTDRDRFNKEFISLEAIQELGISEQSLEITVDRITATRDKEKQKLYTEKLLEKATNLHKSGDSKKALDLLTTNAQRAEAIDRETEFNKLLVPYTEDKVRQTLAGAKEALDTGYTIGQDKLELPAGALSIFSAPTSHGKTSLLINLLLQVASIYPDKEFYLFSYEESGEAILLKALNSYLDLEISKNNRRSLQTYYRTGEDSYIRREALEDFHNKRKEFFTDLIATRRVNIVGSSYDSDSLIKAIQHLNKKTNLGGVFIDYFQLLNLPESRLSNYGSRQTELKEICINLKDLAVDTGLPITLGAQFNREVTSPLKMHPTRIGEAGDIERIANLLIGFWNTAFTPALDKADQKLNKAIQEKGLNLGVPGKLYLEVMKNRDGVAGIEDRLLFNGNTGRIKNSEPLTSF